MKKLALFLLLLVIAVSGSACDPETSGSPDGNHGDGQPIVFVQGGTIDDFVSYLLLTTMDGIDLQGIVVTHTDTIADHAMQVRWKLMQSIQHSGVPVGLSAARGWNAFPWLYRSEVIRQLKIEALRDVEDRQEWPPHPSGDDLLHDVLSKALEQDSPVTLLITCPLTPLSDLLKQHPELEKVIGRLVWMGGAIHADGNLDANTIPAEIANQKAEWNAFWDPQAVDWIFQNTSFPIVMFPLDVTDQARITDEFREELKHQAASHRYSDLVHQSYAVVRDDPFYEMWNTVTTAYVAHPEFFDKPEIMNLEIETEGYDQGTIKQSPDGRQVTVVLNIVHEDAFYEYVLEQFRRSVAPSKAE